jgi:hypothetical protein
MRKARFEPKSYILYLKGTLFDKVDLVIPQDEFEHFFGGLNYHRWVWHVWRTGYYSHGINSYGLLAAQLDAFRSSCEGRASEQDQIFNYNFGKPILLDSQLEEELDYTKNAHVGLQNSIRRMLQIENKMFRLFTVLSLARMKFAFSTLYLLDIY